MSFEDKVVLVSGASRGIGRAIAMMLAEQGATVVGTATSDKGADSISEALKQANLKGTGMVMNVCDSDSVKLTIKSITEAYGAPDILVNNAAITRDNLLMRMKQDEWDDIISTNLSSIFRLSQACLKGMMKKRWGRIINISSLSAFAGVPGQTNYAAAKAGILGFSKSLAQEIASRNITVNVVAPGFIQTDMTKDLPEEYTTAMKKQIAMGHFGEPEDIAAAVRFLASDDAKYVTGATLHVNGGMYMD